MPSFTEISKPTTSFTSNSKPQSEIGGFLLTEDGGYLLQENEAKILLDQGSIYTNKYGPSLTYTQILKPS